MPKQQKGVFFPRKAPKPQPRDPERRTVQNEEYEQVSKRAKEEQVGRDMYRFRFFVTGFFGGGMG
jgi:hypothetical protein